MRLPERHAELVDTHRGVHTVVSTSQLIVDLLPDGGPCAEAADRLIEGVADRSDRTQH